MTADKSVYFAQYYNVNSPAILAKRRLRYKNDPEYRKKMQEKARERARRKADERRSDKIDQMKQYADQIQKHKVDLSGLGSQKVKRWPVGDFVTASVVADALDVSLGTLGNWIRGGVVPPPTVSSTAGKHLFSIQYLDLVRACRIEALRSGTSNGTFKSLMASKYAGIISTEKKLRNGESIE
jgi:hypothetical protein